MPTLSGITEDTPTRDELPPEIPARANDRPVPPPVIPPRAANRPLAPNAPVPPPPPPPRNPDRVGPLTLQPPGNVQAPPAERPFAMALAQGKLQLGVKPGPGRDHVLTAAENLLDKALNKSGQRYARIDNQMLVDTQGFYVKPMASASAVSAFVSSRPVPAAAVANLLPAGNGHIAQKSDVHHSTHGVFRLHDDKLMRFDNQRWVEQTDNQVKLKALHSIGQHLFATDEKRGVYDVHSGHAKDFGRPVSGLMLHNNQPLGLCEANGGYQLRRARQRGVADSVVQLQPFATPGEPAKASKPAAIAMLGNRVFAVDGGGRLSSGVYSDATPAGSNAPPPVAMSLVGDNELAPASRTALDNALGAGRSFSGLFVENDGSLHAKIKDQHGNEHSAHLSVVTQHPLQLALQPGWNLSQALVVPNQRGMPDPTPEANAVIHLETGSIALKDGVLMVQDPRSEKWSKTGDKDLLDLQRGQDGFAYCVDKDGAVKKLTVGLQAMTHQSGKGPNLTVGQANEAKAGSTFHGASGITAKKVAVLNDQRYVTLSDTPGAGGAAATETLNVHDQKGLRRELPVPSPGHPVTSMTVADKQLYVLSNSQIFRMSSDHWQGSSLRFGPLRNRPRWEPVMLPAGVGNISGLRANGRGVLTATSATGKHDLSKTGWVAAQNEPLPATRYQHDLSDRLTAQEIKMTRHGNLKVSAALAGRTGIETAGPGASKVPRSWTKNYLTSHLSLSSMFKSPTDRVTHEFKGRAGLKKIYELDGAAIKALLDKGPTAALPPASATLGRLMTETAPDSKGRELTGLLTLITAEVAQDTQQILQTLAQDQGVQLHNGAATQAIDNPKRNGARDLMPQFTETIRRSGIDHPQLMTLLTSLKANGFRMDSRNPDAKESQRDRSDPHALVKARLANNALVMSKLGGLVEQLDHLQSRPQGMSDDRVDLIAEALSRVYNDEYADNKIKKYTDAGFQSHRELEATYDSVKTMLGYLRKDNHALTRNLRKGFGTDHDQLGAELGKALHQLAPRDNLKINRVYAGTLFGGVSGATGDGFTGGKLTVEPERTYGLTFTRFERGMKMSINREGAVAATANVGVGYGLRDHSIPSGDHPEHMHQNAGYLAASLDAKVKGSHNNAFSFFVPNGLLDEFVTDLVDTELQSKASRSAAQPGVAETRLDPLELMERGVEHELRTSKKLNLDLDLNLGAEFRLNDGRLGDKPVANFFRLALGAVGTANLASYEKESVSGHGAGGLRTSIYTDNRARFLEKASLSGYARMFDPIFTSRPNDVYVRGGVPLGASVTVAVDNKTGKAFDVRFKPAQEVTEAEMKSLASSLEKAFPLIEQGLPTADQPKVPAKEQLGALATLAGGQSRYPALHAATNDAQYAALVSLAQAQRQQSAAESGGSLMNTMDRTIKHANVNRIDKESLTKRAEHTMFDRLLGAFEKEISPGNSAHIAALAAHDPQLAALLKDMKTGDGQTRAEIKLEVKDSIKSRIETEMLQGTMNDAQLRELLSAPSSLRVKSISTFRNVAREDAFNLPGVGVAYRSGSNLSVERLHAEVTFDYGRDQDRPLKGYKVEGKLARNDDGDALKALAAKDFRME
jgi:hypothetical protein